MWKHRPFARGRQVPWPARVAYLMPEEEQALFDALAPRYRPHFLVSLHTGPLADAHCGVLLGQEQQAAELPRRERAPRARLTARRHNVAPTLWAGGTILVARRCALGPDPLA